MKKKKRLISFIIAALILINCFSFFEATDGMPSEVKADSWAKGEFDGSYSPTESAENIKKDKGSIFTKSSVCNTTMYIVYTKMADATSADTLNSGKVTFRKFKWFDYERKGESSDFKSRYALIKHVTDLHNSDWWICKRNTKSYSMLIFLKKNCRHLDSLNNDLNKCLLYAHDVIADDEKDNFALSIYFRDFHPCTQKKPENTSNNSCKKFYTNEGKIVEKFPWKNRTLKGYITADEYLKKGSGGGTAYFKIYAKTSSNAKAESNIMISFTDSMTVTKITRDSTCIKRGRAQANRVSPDKAKPAATMIDIARNNNHVTTYTRSDIESCEIPYDIYTKCLDCGKILSTTHVPAKSHTWDKGKIKYEPTCTESGLKVYKCTVPGCYCDPKEERIPALGHDYDEGKVIREPTCTDEGYKVFRCKRCSDTFTEEIPALGHDYDKGRVKCEPTCCDCGYKEYKCRRCSQTRTEDIPSLGHIDDGKFVTDTEPTCESPGYAYTHCKRCNATLKEKKLLKLGHKWDKGIVYTQPTETEYGKRVYTCKKCGDTKSELIPPKAFSHMDDPGKNKKPKDQTTNPVKDDEYKDSSKLKNTDLQKNLRFKDKSSDGKYRITNVKLSNGKIVGGSVTYERPNNRNCKKMTAPNDVIIDGVTFKVTSISPQAFKGCKNLKKATIGKNILVVGTSAFEGCSKLKTVNIRSKKIRKFGNDCFKGISSKGTIKTPKKYLKKYKKKLIKSGLSKKIKVK